LSSSEIEENFFKIWTLQASELYIEVKNPLEVQFNLFDIHGKVLYSRSQLHLAGMGRFQLPALSPGVYLVELSGENFRTVEKVILF
jgi:hypothetical protein